MAREQTEDDNAEENLDLLPPRHFSSVPKGRVSPNGDEPPLVVTRLSDDGSHIIEETLSPAGGVISRFVKPR